MKRPKNARLGELVQTLYVWAFCEQEDLAPTSRCTYVSDIIHFIMCCEARVAVDEADAQDDSDYNPQVITIPALTCYRTYNQTVQKQILASVERSLISLKHYFGWELHSHLISYDPSIAIKLVGQEDSAPRQLGNQEEKALIVAVTKVVTLRGCVLIVLLLLTDLRACVICQIRRDQLRLGKRSGFLEVIGQYNKYREVQFNVTARKVVQEYLPTLFSDSTFLYSSGKTKNVLSEQAFGYTVKKYETRARPAYVGLHNLRHRFGYRIAESVPLHRLEHTMGHDSFDTIKLYINWTKRDLLYRRLLRQ